MKRDIVPDARKRLNELSREAAVQFESSIVHNRVWERISEDGSLRQLLDVAEQAYNLECNRNHPDSVRETAFGAAEDLNDHVDRLVEDIVARECAASIEDARGDWFDAAEIGEEVVEEAFNEACAWLADHPDAAERNEIDVDETVWGEEAEVYDDWDPEPATLRDDETEDDRTHARRNAEALRRAREELGRDGDADEGE